MTLTVSIIAILLVVTFIVFRQSLEKKKYKATAYLSALQKIASFFDTLRTLDDYVTWVQRDQIKSEYSAVGKYLKSKSNF